MHTCELETAVEHLCCAKEIVRQFWDNDVQDSERETVRMVNKELGKIPAIKVLRALLKYRTVSIGLKAAKCLVERCQEITDASRD